MSTTLSPNMNLIIPGVGTEAGPAYATDLNTSLSILDQHSHGPGSGVLITPAALDINSTLSFAGNLAINLAGLNLIAQNSTPAISTVYQSGVDLYFVDALGNNIQITANGGVAGSPGSISNLTSPASAAYVAGSKTFVWQSDTSIAANMDMGSIILRNITPNSTFGVTILAPAALSANYSINLPSALPGSQKIVTLDGSGNLSAPYSVDNSTLTISANVIKVADSGITATQIAANAVTTAKILDANVTSAKLASNLNLPGTTVEINSKIPVVSNTNSSTNLSIIAGQVTAAGAIAAGDGFTVNRTGTGQYTITFTTAYSAAPIAICTLNDTGAGYVSSNGSTTADIRVRTFSNTATLTNVSFNFLIVGIRA